MQIAIGADRHACDQIEAVTSAVAGPGRLDTARESTR
jgi:hypothetical protein